MEDKVITPVLESPRLFLKPLNKSFLSEEYLHWLNDKKITKYMSTGGNYDLKKLNDYLDDLNKNPKYFWAIILKKNNKHIGNIKIDPIDFSNKTGEYGIMIGEKTVWGQGIANESSKLALNYCFNELGLKKIYLGVIAENKRAIQSYKSIGFSEEYFKKKFHYLKGEYYDFIRMSITLNSL